MSSLPEACIADWTKLWRLAQRLALEERDEPASVFERIGLFLEDPAEQRRCDYDVTPANSIMIASTGGDGVHFSALVTGSGGSAPIVMTVPMAFDTPNHVLGSDLREFLALGRARGYFGLERLAYQWERPEAIAQLQADYEPTGSRQAEMLQLLIEEFDLQPWRDVGERLDELASAHSAQL
ncbi:hypothetical protein AB0J80_32815 [Actinoplanes sp. NPDC049548]|uniref:hypothetical protein n=1 Tax=Actinoplanes sp. NPDC049548 TaxID=3155152 RepID=UPI0034305CC4